MVDIFGEPAGPPLESKMLPDGSIVAPEVSMSGDPQFRVWLPPGISGSPTEPERFRVQLPLDALFPPFESRPAVVGFHFFGVSEDAVFNQTLPQLCQQKGWFLIAPWGFNQVNFANEQSQAGVDAILDWIEQFVDLDDERFYGVGFSMGGLNALSYAWRHQNPSGRRFAAAASLLGTVDPVYAFENGTGTLQGLLTMPEVFGASPAVDPYAYERVATALLTPSLTIDDLNAGVNNLLDTPVYLGINTADPTTALLTQNNALASYLQSKGFPVTVDSFSGQPSHAWGNFDQGAVIDFFEGKVAPAPEPTLGPPMDLYSDRVEVVRFAEVREIDPETVARVRVTLGFPGSNSFALENLRGLRELALDPDAIGIDTAQPVLLTSFGEDPAATGTRIVLSGYPQPPSAVTVLGAQPALLSHDPITAELTIQPRADSTFTITAIVP